MCICYCLKYFTTLDCECIAICFIHQRCMECQGYTEYMQLNKAVPIELNKILMKCFTQKLPLETRIDRTNNGMGKLGFCQNRRN